MNKLSSFLFILLSLSPSAFSVYLERLQKIHTHKYVGGRGLNGGIAQTKNVVYHMTNSKLLMFNAENFAYLGKVAPHGGFQNPRDIMATPDGRVFVVDQGGFDVFANTAKVHVRSANGNWYSAKLPITIPVDLSWFQEYGHYKFIIPRQWPKRIVVMDENFHMEREIDVTNLPRMKEDRWAGTPMASRWLKGVVIWQALKLDNNASYVLSYSSSNAFSYLAMVNSEGRLQHIVSGRNGANGKGFRELTQIVRDKRGYFHCSNTYDRRVLTFDSQLKYVTELDEVDYPSKIAYDPDRDRLIAATRGGVETIRIHY